MRNALVISGFVLCFLLILISSRAQNTQTKPKIKVEKHYESYAGQNVLTEDIDHELFDVLLRVEHEVSKTWDESDALRYKLTAPVQPQEPLDLDNTSK